MRALLICNANDADSGFIGEAFRRHGYAFAECHRERSAEWPDLAGHELVLLLGSDWSVFWEHLAEEVEAEARLLREAVERGIPVFAICYGAQMVAQTFGGRVERAPVHEVGWLQIDSDDPDVIAAGPWFEWHYDSIVELPPGAAECARTELAPQAFTLGRVFATQFHPEVTNATVERWARFAGASELERLEMSADDLIEATRSSTQLSRSNALRLVDWFCEHVVPSDAAEVLRTC